MRVWMGLLPPRGDDGVRGRGRTEYRMGNTMELSRRSAGSFVGVRSRNVTSKGPRCSSSLSISAARCARFSFSRFFKRTSAASTHTRAAPARMSHHSVVARLCLGRLAAPGGAKHALEFLGAKGPPIFYFGTTVPASAVLLPQAAVKLGCALPPALVPATIALQLKGRARGAFWRPDCAAPCPHRARQPLDSDTPTLALLARCIYLVGGLVWQCASGLLLHSST